MLFGLNLKVLLLVAPVFMVTLLGAYYLLLKTKNLFSIGHDSILRGMSFDYKHVIIFFLTVSPLALYWSWMAFWMLSVLLLMICLFHLGSEHVLTIETVVSNSRNFDLLIFVLIALAAVGLSYAVSRSDLDDSFYVAVASFVSSNPSNIIISTDPMLGEPGFPLIFPSYRFASFELLLGAIAYLLSVPAMDVYYIYSLPVWAVAVVAANFLLAKELIPKHWVLAGTVAFLLTLLLGEMHRSPANFSFVRIFQGKAVFLSVIVPTIFYLTARFFSERGNKADLFLLACCQIASVGLTNFGMLMGPIVGFGALISNLPLSLKGDRRKIYYACSILLISFPYLINVALESSSSPILNFGSESGANVWTSVFGSHQQYLVGFLILTGPVLAKDTVTKWRMAVPPLLLFALYLNPWLAGFISKYVTTPPVYWRVVWSFPILLFAAVSFCMIVDCLFERKSPRLVPAVLSTVMIALIVYSLPFNTLRSENIGPLEGFATWKVSDTHLVVAQKTIAIDNHGGRLLAPDEIAGVISRFEVHPRLISTRGLYLDLMRPMVGDEEFMPRKLLYDFVTGNDIQQIEKVRSALRSLDVSVIVLKLDIETNSVLTLLVSEGFKQRESVDGYSIWARRRL